MPDVSSTSGSNERLDIRPRHIDEAVTPRRSLDHGSLVEAVFVLAVAALLFGHDSPSHVDRRAVVLSAAANRDQPVSKNRKKDAERKSSCAEHRAAHISMPDGGTR